jgi:orotate phosphoribosyltransferase
MPSESSTLSSSGVALRASRALGDGMNGDRDRLRSLLREHSLIFGDFTLASGRKSNFYFDSKRTTLLPEGAYLTAREILRLVRERGIAADAIGGLTLGADPIVCPVAALSHVEGPSMRAFIVRKELKGHGTGRKIEGILEPGSRVIVVDDVVTTAESTLQAIGAAVDAGHRVVAVICLVDREEGGSSRLSDWPFFPVFRRSELFDAAEARS